MVVSDKRFERSAMRFLPVLFWVVLSAGPAAAFDCSDPTLPSTIVICSDPELAQLADDRQRAINETRARIGEDRWPALWEDQKAWVRSYAIACSVPQDRPAPNPVPASVRACFKLSAQARIAYLRAYGLPAGDTSLVAAPAAPDRIGPSYDCTNASRPLERMICADADLSRLDLQFNQAYWALLYALGPAGQQPLKVEDIAFVDRVQEQCRIPVAGPLTDEVRRSRDCVGNAYENERKAWIERLTGPAHQEAIRPIEHHVALQKALQALGFIPPVQADGVYGAATRAGITVWQSARGLAVTGFLGNADASALEQEIASRQVLASRDDQTSKHDHKPFQDRSPDLQRNEILMKRNGDTYTVRVRINDAVTLDFLVDSGASDVSVPADVVLTLMRTGTLSTDDFIGKQAYRLADGSEVKSTRFLIHQLTIGPYTVSNVTASIGSIESGLLLGQSLLSRFGSVTLDNNRHVLVLGEPNR
jgi:uncharacterized protein/predicted aspartyl protease